MNINTVTAQSNGDEYFEWTGLHEGQSYEIVNVHGTYIEIRIEGEGTKSYHASWFGLNERDARQLQAEFYATEYS